MLRLCNRSVPLKTTEEYREHLSYIDKINRRTNNIRTTKVKGEQILNVPIEKIMTDIIECDLEPKGDGFTGRCINPSHEDSRPSMRVFPKTNTFFCWACGEWGDAVGAVSLAFSLNWKQSTELIKEKILT